MISYTDSLSIITQAVSRKTVTLPLAECAGKVCARDIHSPMAVPSFHNAAMDGFAIKVQQFEAHKEYPIKKYIYAGDITATEDDGVFAIMTGAPLPPQTDSVIPFEDCSIAHNQVIFNRLPRPGENVRYIGEDYHQDDQVILAGEVITAERIAALAGCGIASVEVFTKPSLYIFTTGDELVLPGSPLAHGQIYNSNHYYLTCQAQSLGLDYQASVLTDDYTPSLESLRQVPPGSLILTTGAVSKGTKDFIPQLIQELGGEVLFHKVAIKPGKPVLLAKLPENKYWVGLPGNPVSTAVGFDFFVRPLLQALCLQPRLPYWPAIAINHYQKKPGLHHFLKAFYHVSDSGQLMVEILQGQESFKLKPLSQMNCWLHSAADQQTIKPGDIVKITPVIQRGDSR